ncbi:MAG: hypothetical protein OHK0013_25010 [Sandaracinaceae bacterium]
MSPRTISSLFTVAVIALSSTTAHAQQAGGSEVELFDYVVQEGDSCARIAERFFGNRRRYDLIHAYNPDMGPPPHDLEPGRVLHIPRRAVPASELADATVTAVERRVEARPRPIDEAWIAAQRGLGLYRGGRVATQSRSAAELTFRDTSVVQLREETLVIIFGATSTATRQSGMEATLETGALRTRLGELRGETSGNSLRVVTGSGTASLTGGSAVVSVDGSGTSRLSNHTSRAGLQASVGGPAVALPPDTGSLVRRGERPTPPRPLPAAPTWIIGERRSLGVAGHGGSVAGQWAFVPGASRYHVELARQPDGRDVVFATDVPSTITRFEAHRLPAGVYYATVATIDGDLFESRPSSAARFEILEGRTLAPGEDPASPPPAFDPGDPSIDPRPEVEVLEGTTYVAPEGIACEPASPIALRPDLVVRCTTTAGEPVATPHFVVRGVSTAIEGLAEGTPLTLARGSTNEVVLAPALEGGLPEDLALVASDGILVERQVREGGRVRATLVISREATLPAELRWVRTVAPTRPIGRMPVMLAAAPTRGAVSAESGAPAPPPRSPRLTEAFARSPVSSALVLDDLDRRGSTVGLSLAEVAPRPRNPIASQRTRLAVAGDLALFDDQLVLGTIVPVDLVGTHNASWERGALDVWAHARWVPLRRDPAADASLALAVDLGAWIPTHAGEPSGLPSVRIAPSIATAFAIERVLAFRTRQGALIDLDEAGARLWASAYGLDLELFGPIAVGVEIDLAVGRERERSLFALGLSPQLAIDVDPVALSLGLRFGLNRDGQDVFGAAAVALGASVAIR